MRAFKAVIAALSLVSVSLVSVKSVSAATYVYVSNAEDGDIGIVHAAGRRHAPAGRARRGRQTGDADEREPGQGFLFAAVRSKPFAVLQPRDRRKTGALKPVGGAPLAESFPYIWARQDRALPARRLVRRAIWSASTRRRGRHGRRAAAGDPDRPQRALDRTDESNKFVFVPTSAPTRSSSSASTRRGQADANTPPVVQMKPGTGPRHFIMSADNKFVYLLTELHRDGDDVRARRQDRHS